MNHEPKLAINHESKVTINHEPKVTINHEPFTMNPEPQVALALVNY